MAAKTPGQPAAKTSGRNATEGSGKTATRTASKATSKTTSKTTHRRAGPAEPARAAATPRWRLRHQGDRCISIDLALSLGERAARECMAIATFLREAALPGVTDVVPSFTAVAVHYRPLPGDAPPMAERLEQQLHARAAAAGRAAQAEPRVVEVPVCYGGDFGPDLADVARRTGMTEDEVVALHRGRPSTVLMVGFVPGLPYMGVSDERLALPRREVPRVRVEAGSVAIANRQTVIYPTVSPGGWHLIGRTPLVLFDPDREQPTLLMPGDRVRFMPISPDEYARLAAEIGSAAR